MVTLLVKHDREVVIAIVDNKHLKYYDIKETNLYIINPEDNPISDLDLDLSVRYSWRRLQKWM